MCSNGRTDARKEGKKRRKVRREEGRKKEGRILYICAFPLSSALIIPNYIPNQNMKNASN
jgi:hypothetical protein